MEDFDKLSRVKLDEFRKRKAEIQQAVEKNHAEVYAKFKENEGLLLDRLAVVDQVDAVIDSFGIKSESSRLKRDSNKKDRYARTCETGRIPIPGSDDSSDSLFAVAWKTAYGRTDVSLLRRLVSFVHRDEIIVETGVTLFAIDSQSGDEVLVARFGLFDLERQRLALESGDMYSISVVKTVGSRTDENLSGLRDILGIIGQTAEIQQTQPV